MKTDTIKIEELRENQERQNKSGVHIKKQIDIYRKIIWAKN